MVLGIPDLLKQICDFVKKGKYFGFQRRRRGHWGQDVNVAWERHTVHDDCTKHLLFRIYGPPTLVIIIICSQLGWGA